MALKTGAEQDRASRSHLQALFDHRWSVNRLSEVYIIERHFDGTRQPFMTLEYGATHAGVKLEHSLDDEAAEYEVEVDHIRRFVDDAALKAQLSSPIGLCLKETDGSFAHGFVYSVPINSDAGLVGIVSAMIPIQQIEAQLGLGHYSDMAILANERGDIIGCQDLPDETREWFERQFAERGVLGFYAGAPETFKVGEWQTLWTPVDIVSDTRWWLAFQYRGELPSSGPAAARVPGLATAAGVLLIGILLALVADSVFRRLEKQVLVGQMVAGQERERRRVAMELHDGPTQTMAAILRRLEFCEALANGEGEGVVPELEYLQELVRASLSEMRGLIGDLRPPSLDLLGFVPTARQHCRDFERASGITVRLDVTGHERDLDGHQAAMLFRILQEALSNVRKHAGAQTVSVELAYGTDDLRMTVVDDGKGFPMSRPDEVAPDHWRFGLLGMQERTELLAGTFRLESSPGEGTMVIIDIPLADATETSGGRTGIGHEW